MNSTGENLPTPAANVTPDQIAATLAQSHSADDCVALAGLAEMAGDVDLLRKCLGQAIALDRNCRPALVMLAAQSMDDGDVDGTFALLEEAHRAGVLPDEAAPLHRALHDQVAGSEQLENYFRAIGHIAAGKPDQKLAIVLVTNLFPPQELGGYGRMMWEFAHGLIVRGHTVRILTSDTTEFGKNPTPDELEMEQHVFRTLKMAGTWVGGRPAPLTNRAEIIRRLRDNASRVRTAVNKLDADLVLAGNIDFLGTTLLQPALQGGVPVLHALANAAPGYSLAEQPKETNYWVAPCSDWNGEVFTQAGFAPNRVATVYPGARVDRFFRLFLPDTRRLRICYASLMLPYKGANTLVHALGRLHAAGVDFTAEIAGDAPNAEFLKEMQDYVKTHGMESKVKFTGFLDRRGLSALFARSNVLVFPSQFQEPFGISQVEALAAGLVVVSSGTGGAKEVIRDGVDGLLFTAGNDTELASKLATLAQQPELMTKLQRNAQSRAISFSVEKSVLKIEALAAEMQAAAATDPLAALAQL